MTDQEMEMWQHIDECRDEVKRLIEEVRDIRKQFTVFTNLLAESIEEERENNERPN